MIHRVLVVLLFALTPPSGPGAVAAVLAFPPPSGRVIDEARVLSSASEAALTAKLARLAADTGTPFVVVIPRSLQGAQIEDYGDRLGRHWGLGAAGTEAGVILIVAPAEHRVRLEIGQELEPVLSDALSNRIIQTDIIPPLREGGYVRGITAGVDAVIAQLRLDPALAQVRAQAARPTVADPPVVSGLVVILIFLFFFLNLHQGLCRPGKRIRRTGGGLAPVWVWGGAVRPGSSSGGFGGGGASGRW